MARKSKQLDARKSYAFFVEGETERWYLKQVHNDNKHIYFNIEPKLVQAKIKQPDIKRIKNLAKDKVYSKIFWIIDFDTIVNENRTSNKKILDSFISNYQTISKQSNTEIIINNPCFELWLLLHYKYTTKYYPDYNSLLMDLIKHLPLYEKTDKYYNSGEGLYSKLKSRLQEAIANSQKLGVVDFNNITQSLCEMYKIFNEL